MQRYERNTRLAYKIAGEFYLVGGEPADLRQEARVALWLAARSFDGQGTSLTATEEQT